VDIRANRGALVALGVGVTLVPGFALFGALRAGGLAVGPAGLLGLLVIFVGCFAFSGWAWSGLGRDQAARSAVVRHEPEGSDEAAEEQARG
jgi:hypothetical protein